MKDKHIADLTKLAESFKAAAAAPVILKDQENGRQKPLVVLDFRAELQKLAEQRKSQEDKAAKQIADLKAKLQEARAQLLVEAQRMAVPVPAEKSDRLQPKMEGDPEKDRKIVELTKELARVNQELTATKKERDAAIEEAKNTKAEAEKYRELAAELQKQNEDLQSHLSIANAAIAAASVHRPVAGVAQLLEEQKEIMVPRAEFERAIAAANPHPLAQSLPIEAADLVSGAGPGPESSKSGEENVGDEARDNNAEAEENRREDVSAESGSTALVEKGAKNEQKEGQYENPTTEIKEEPEENDEPRDHRAALNAGEAEDHNDFDVLPLSEEVKERVLLAVPIFERPQPAAVIESDAGQSPIQDADDFFESISQAHPGGVAPTSTVLHSPPLVPPAAVRPVPAPAPVPVHLTAPAQTQAATGVASKKKMDVVPDDLF